MKETVKDIVPVDKDSVILNLLISLMCNWLNKIDGAPTLGPPPCHGTASELTPCFYKIQHTLVHLNTADLGQ